MRQHRQRKRAGVRPLFCPTETDERVAFGRAGENRAKRILSFIELNRFAQRGGASVGTRLISSCPVDLELELPIQFGLKEKLTPQFCTHRAFPSCLELSGAHKRRRSASSRH